MKQIAILFSLLLSSCAVVHTTDKYADGRKITTTGIEIGRTEALTNYRDNATKDGREISIGSASADVNVDAIKASGATLGVLVGTAVKTYTGVP